MIVSSLLRRWPLVAVAVTLGWMGGAVMAAMDSASATDESEKVIRLPEIRVFGDPFLEVVPLSTEGETLDSATMILPMDAADLMRGVPGAAVVRNGPLTGIVQLRGMQNERVKVLVDGMTLTPACPNHMDPPMHYAMPGALERVTVMAGLVPVSEGGDSLAGTVRLDSAPPRFATNQALLTTVNAKARVETGNRGGGGSGLLPRH